MLVVSMTKRQVLRRTPDGAIAVHADLGHIATFHCNDMVVDSAGGAYVGNFGFDLDAEIAARGVPSVLANHPTAKLAYVAPDGQARVAAEDMHFPNGPVITPDGKTLILGETLGGVLTAFDIGPDGDLSNRRVWAPTRAARARRHLPRRRRRDLGRQPHRAGVRADRRGRRGAGGDRDRPALLRLHAGRRRRQDAVHADRRELGLTRPPPRPDRQDPGGRGRQPARRAAPRRPASAPRGARNR